MTVPVRLRVPYVTAHSGEDVSYELALKPDPEATDGRRLSYADAVPTDWMFGVLWHRHGMTRAGDPEWTRVNTARQRRCMTRRLCQVCGMSATDADGLTWWVMAEEPGRTAAGEPFTNAPPTCPACIPEALTLCPRLRKQAHIFTSRGCEPYGVVADIYRPIGAGLLTASQTTELPLDAFRQLEYALAKQLLVTLDGLTVAAIPR